MQILALEKNQKQNMAQLFDALPRRGNFRRRREGFGAVIS